MKSMGRPITFVLYILFNIGVSYFATRAQNVHEMKLYKGMCDASAAVALDENTFIVSSDEDNDLRIYDKHNPAEIQRTKLSEIFKRKISDGEDLEIDLEGATWLGDKIFWIGSHSARKSERVRPSRHRLFAIKVSRNWAGRFEIASVGKIYTDLITDLDKDARFKDLRLQSTRKVNPKDIGGINIEALAATPEGHLLIGFRNPLSGGKVSSERILTNGKSLIVELVNPLEVIEGKAAEFAAPIVLGLNGLGIRGMEYDTPRRLYFIIAGPYFDRQEINLPRGKALEQRLYLWSGKRAERPEFRQEVNLTGFNAETAFLYPGAKTRSVELLSDDGKSSCRDGFRSLQITIK